MDDEKAARQTALDQLRHDMLNFIVDEISARVEEDKLPAVGKRLDRLVAERADAALATALQGSKLVDTRELAAELAKIAKGDSSVETRDESGTGSDVGEPGEAEATSFAEGNRRKTTLKVPEATDRVPPPRWHERAVDLIWKYWPFAVIAGLAVAVGFLVYGNGSYEAANKRANELSEARKTQVDRACAMARQMDNEAKLLRDDARWKSTCTGRNPSDRDSQICRTQAALANASSGYRQNCR